MRMQIVCAFALVTVAQSATSAGFADYIFTSNSNAQSGQLILAPNDSYCQRQYDSCRFSCTRSKTARYDAVARCIDGCIKRHRCR